MNTDQKKFVYEFIIRNSEVTGDIISDLYVMIVNTLVTRGFGYEKYQEIFSEMLNVSKETYEEGVQQYKEFIAKSEGIVKENT
jgi:hypothetical protein